MSKDEALRLALEALKSIFASTHPYREDGTCTINDDSVELSNKAITAIEEALEAKDKPAVNNKDTALRLAIESLCCVRDMVGHPDNLEYINHQVAKIEAALEAKDEPHGWKLVPIEPTYEMLKAMDECSTEGYDERLYAGIASSVYMAAVEVAPKPPKQEIKNEPKCVAIVEVFGKDWRLDYMALPVGKHKLYAQQYTYTTPPQRTWVGLKDDDEIPWDGVDAKSFARAIEAKLKEKNT